jgi:hypothetical protein
MPLPVPPIQQWAQTLNPVNVGQLAELARQHALLQDQAFERQHHLYNQSQTTMETFFANLFDRIKNNAQTTIMGGIGVIAPAVLSFLSVPPVWIPVVSASIGIANALFAKTDGFSVAGAGGNVIALALHAAGVPVPVWVLELGNGFFGFFSKDQASVQPAKQGEGDTVTVKR